MSEMKLIPYQIEEITEDFSNIPEGIQLIEAPALWERTKRGKGTVVAVIDTGCQTDHPDLIDRIIDGKNFTTDYQGDTENYADNNGHGTHVAGTIAAAGTDNGIVGVAPQADLLILKVLTKEGSGRMDWIIDAIQYAVNWEGSTGEKVQVISMSLGGPHDVPELHDSIKYAVRHNVSVVCAAGNEGDEHENTDEFSYPGAYNEVIQVGAIDFQHKLAPFTNTNDEIDLVAPGVRILSTYPKSRYAKLTGTSMATPHVSGALALLINLAKKDFKRNYTETELYAQLIKRTIPAGYSMQGQGNGILTLGFADKISNLFSTYTKKWEAATPELKTVKN